MCGLRFFEIYINLGCATLGDYNLSFLMGSLYMSLTSPATLEHLEFNIGFRHHYTYFNPYKFIEDLCDAHVWWSSLDSTTHPIGSRLQSRTSKARLFGRLIF